MSIEARLKTLEAACRLAKTAERAEAESKPSFDYEAFLVELESFDQGLPAEEVRQWKERLSQLLAKATAADNTTFDFAAMNDDDLMELDSLLQKTKPNGGSYPRKRE